MRSLFWNGFTRYASAPASRAWSTRSRCENAVRISTAASRSPAIVRAAVSPSMPGILMSRIARSGSSSRTSSIGVVAAAGLADDLVVLFFEDLLEVEADDRLVLGEDDADGLASPRRPGVGRARGRSPSSAAMRSSSASCSSSSSRDRAAQRVALAGLRVGVAAHVAGLGVGDRRLRDQRAQPGVLGLGLEERALLVGDGQLRAQPLEAVAHVDEAALQQGARHRTCQSTCGPGVAA